MTIFVFFIILGFFGGAMIGYCYCINIVKIFDCGIIGCITGIILFGLFLDSPLNIEDINAVYKLQAINSNSYYTTSSSGGQISVHIKKENGFERISIDENLVTFVTSDTPKIEVEYKKSKFVPEKEDIYKKAVVYLPEDNNSINIKNTTGSITCPTCDSGNKEDAKFCNKWNEESKIKTKLYCSNCDKEISKDAKYCQYCGEKVN